MDDTTQISEFRKRILQDPEALLNDREVMRALISASSNNAPTNLIDLKSVVLKRLEGRGRLCIKERNALTDRLR